MKRYILFTVIILFCCGCNFHRKAESTDTADIKLDTVTLSDPARNRKIPVAFYDPGSENPEVVVFSHGYGQNRRKSYLAYSYLTHFLALKGYFVVSVQHELPTDELIPSAGIPQIVRRPFWERGADNILFVINQLKKDDPRLNFRKITLIGHSNGADMTALFPQKYPHIAHKIITLDNRRMVLPRDKNLKVYTLRSSDQPADEGVLPTDPEIRKFEITIIKLSDVKHNDMDDHADAVQRKEIQDYILKFLKD